MNNPFLASVRYLIYLVYVIMSDILHVLFMSLQVRAFFPTVLYTSWIHPYKELNESFSLCTMHMVAERRADSTAGETVMYTVV